MKVIISASIDEAVRDSLDKFCERVVDNRTYKINKSNVVQDAIKEHIARNGGDGK
jgi:hypothetical protein